MIVLMYVATIHRLKQGQGQQNQNDFVDPEQGYSQAKFERSPFNGV